MAEFTRYEFFMLLNQPRPLWLCGADLSGLDLRGVNLQGATLFSANLNKCGLRGADMREANLGGATLIECNLVGADLRRAYLRGADLHGSDLREANLTEADLFEANLSGTNLLDANLGGADLTAANLTDANLSGTNAPDYKISAGEVAERRDYARRHDLRSIRILELALHGVGIAGQFDIPAAGDGCSRPGAGDPDRAFPSSERYNLTPGRLGNGAHRSSRLFRGFQLPNWLDSPHLSAGCAMNRLG